MRPHGLRGFYLDDNFAIVPNRVRGYLVARDSKIEFQDGTNSTRDYLKGTVGAVTNARAYDISARYPAGGFDATGEDLMKFVVAVGSGRVLPPPVLTEMWSAQKTKDGADTVFGIGWGVSKWKDRAMVGINGAEPSTTTLLRYFPQEGVGAAVLCNAEGAQDLRRSWKNCWTPRSNRASKSVPRNPDESSANSRCERALEPGDG